MFELANNLGKMLIYKPKRIYKSLVEEYDKRIEDKYGENIIRNIVQTTDFSFPSEDYTG